MTLFENILHTTATNGFVNRMTKNHICIVLWSLHYIMILITRWMKGKLANHHLYDSAKIKSSRNKPDDQWHLQILMYYKSSY